jgi:hypothetical protein
MDDVYKLGYTANKQTPELVKQHLINRYGTYFPDVECVELFEVVQPVQAEKHLFDLLTDYKYKNEMYKADYELTIKPQLETIKALYCRENGGVRVLSEKEKKKIEGRFVKKIKQFVNHLWRIQSYIYSNMSKFNQHNSRVLCNVANCMSLYNVYCSCPPKEKALMTLYTKQFISDVHGHIQQLDFADSAMVSFIEFIESLY